MDELRLPDTVLLPEPEELLVEVDTGVPLRVEVDTDEPVVLPVEVLRLVDELLTVPL